MSWVKLDDQARHHRKILAVGPTAAWLWACGLMYCNAQKARDGFIPSEAVQILYPVPAWKKEVPKLVAQGLWEPVEGGYQVHDYHDYQPNSDAVSELSEKRAAAGRAGGRRSGETRASKPAEQAEATAKQNGKQFASKQDEANAKQNEARPDPDPVPTKEDPPKGPHEGQVGLLGMAAPPPRARPAKVDLVGDVFAAYQRIRKQHRPSSRGTALKPDERVRAAKLLEAGYSPADLQLACEGLFRSQHHNGENDRGTEYLAFFHAMSPKAIDQLIELGRRATEQQASMAAKYGSLPPLEPDDDVEPVPADDDDPLADLLGSDLNRPVLREPKNQTPHAEGHAE